MNGKQTVCGVLNSLLAFITFPFRLMDSFNSLAKLNSQSEFSLSPSVLCQFNVLNRQKSTRRGSTSADDADRTAKTELSDAQRRPNFGRASAWCVRALKLSWRTPTLCFFLTPADLENLLKKLKHMISLLGQFLPSSASPLKSYYLTPKWLRPCVQAETIRAAGCPPWSLSPLG